MNALRAAIIELKGNSVKVLILAGVCVALLGSSVNAASENQITILDPSGSPSYFESETPNPLASVFMIGVYETRSDHSFMNHPVGKATVSIGEQNGRDTILVLSSYEPTQWNVIGDGVDDLSRVLLYGYHEQTIGGLDNLRLVTEYSNLGSGSYHGFSYNFPGDGRVVRHVRSETGLGVDAFAGTYRATQFVIAAAVPEPNSVLLTMLGLLGVGIQRKRSARLDV